LEQAKQNLVNHYLLVGTTSDLESFVAVLESLVPRMFKGAVELYRSGGDAQHIRRTNHKDEPSEATLDEIRESKIYKMEREFYDFAASQFNSVVRDFKQQEDMRLVLGQTNFFHYEKVRPRPTN
jgi:heparan sulfate 2-O-sulfotransferase HS2ST1